MALHEQCVGKTNEWYTPPHVFNALGCSFDIDVSSPGKDVTPHVLRHSRATHLMMAGISIWEAAKSLGMTAEMVERVYGHHHPDWQKDASQVR